jgi:hypothetical protein
MTIRLKTDIGRRIAEVRTGCARGCLLYIIAIIVYIILFVAIGIN